MEARTRVGAWGLVAALLHERGTRGRAAGERAGKMGQFHFNGTLMTSDARRLQSPGDAEMKTQSLLWGHVCSRDRQAFIQSVTMY